MKKQFMTAFSISVLIWHICYAFSIGNFFNPFQWSSKAFKVAKIITDEMWDFKPSDIGKTLNPYEFGRDSMTRGIVLGMKLRRAMMEEDFGLMDTMTLYGFKAYEFGANVMPGDYEDKVLAEMIKVILSNDEITKEFIKEALKYEGLSSLMLRIADRNPEILDKLVEMMAVDNSISELLIKLAIQNRQIGKLLFRKMNNTSFRVLINSMYESKSVSSKATELFSKMADYVFSNSSHFKNYFFLPENSIYVEKMIYSVFKNKKAIDNFEQFFQKIPEEWQYKMINYITNGIDPDGGVYPDEPYYFMHAVIKGIIDGKSLKHILEKDMSPYESLKPVVNKFMKTLVTGAKIYDEKQHKKLLNELGKLGVMENDEDNEQIEPDTTIPPPRIKTSSKDEKKAFKISKQDLDINITIKHEIDFFGFEYKGKKLYSEGDNDKWLLLPYWLSPATWIKLSNKEEVRNIENTQLIGKIKFKNDDEFLVFILASQFSPCVVWALKQGFVPIYGEFIETEKQTGFVLLGKVFGKNNRKIPLYGNGGGSYNYIIGIMKENEHPMYLFAKNKILNSSIDYKIKSSQLFDYASFDPQIVYTVKPENIKVAHKVFRSAIPMFNDTFLKKEKSFIMIDKRNGTVEIGNIESFSKFNLTYPPTDKQVFSITYGKGLYVAVGEDKKIYLSEDGNKWESVKVDRILYDVAYGDGKFVAVGEDGYIFVLDLETKQVYKLDRKKTKTKGKDLLDVEYINGEFYVVGEKGIISSSSLDDIEDQWQVTYVDLKTVLGLEKEINWNITRISFIDKYYITTDYGTVLYSPDLINWFLGIQLDSMTPLTDISYLPDRNIILAAGLNGVIVTSKDGINWDDVKLLDCESFVGVVPVEGKGFLLLGRNGKIVKFYPYYDDMEKAQYIKDENKSDNLESISKSQLSSTGCSLSYQNDAFLILILVVSFMYLFNKTKRFLI